MNINNKKNIWKYFECQQCGTCCITIGLPYDPTTIFEIADFLKLSVEEVIATYYGKMTADGLNWESIDSKRTPCQFLRNSEGKHYCHIYDVRPTGCRLYPIDTDGGRDGVSCPGWDIAFSKLKKEQL